MPKVKLIVDGGNMKPGPAVAQQLGPMGINLGKVIADVNVATSGFKGMQVPVELDVDPKTKSYEITVLSPSMSAMIKKEMGLEKGSGESKKMKAGNVSFETCIKVAKTKMPDLLAKDLKAAVKLVVGSCVSLGVLIDSKEPKDIEQEIVAGKYDKEISGEITEPSTEKKKQLEDYFNQVHATEAAKKKSEDEAKAAEETAKTEAAAAGKAEEETKKVEPKKVDAKKK